MPDPSSEKTATRTPTDLYDELVGLEINVELDEETIRGVLIAIRAVNGIPVAQIQPKGGAPPKLIPWSRVRMIQPTNGYRYDVEKLKRPKGDEQLEWMS